MHLGTSVSCCKHKREPGHNSKINPITISPIMRCTSNSGQMSMQRPAGYIKGTECSQLSHVQEQMLISHLRDLDRDLEGV